jgi:hypothetical protein
MLLPAPSEAINQQTPGYQRGEADGCLRGPVFCSRSPYSGTSAIGGVQVAGIPAWKYSMVAPTGKAGMVVIVT